MFYYPSLFESEKDVNNSEAYITRIAKENK